MLESLKMRIRRFLIGNPTLIMNLKPVVAVCLSTVTLFILYSRWPKYINYDANFSMFVAENARAGNGFVGMEHLITSCERSSRTRLL